MVPALKPIIVAIDPLEASTNRGVYAVVGKLAALVYKVPAEA